MKVAWGGYLPREGVCDSATMLCAKTSVMVQRLCQLQAFYRPMYLGLVFFTGI